MAVTPDDLAGRTDAELRHELAEVMDRLAALPPDDPARGALAARRADLRAALRRAVPDTDRQLAEWAERSRPGVDRARPVIPSHGEGGGAGSV